MDTGCSKCDEIQKRKGDKTALCDKCNIDYLEATAFAAAMDYRDAVDEYIKKLEEKYDKKIDELSRKL